MTVLEDQILESEKASSIRARKYGLLFLVSSCICIILLSVTIIFSNDKDEKRLSELEAKLEKNGDLSESESEAYCQLRLKVYEEPIDDCKRRLQHSRRKGSTKDSRKSNANRVFSLNRQIDSLKQLQTQTRHPPLNKAEKKEFKGKYNI